MALTTTQAESLTTQAAFLARLEYALTLTAENVASEATGTARHAQRAAMASQILNNPDQAARNWAPGVVAQLPLASANMVGTTDVDTTDAALATIVSSIYNDFLAAGF